MSTETAYFTLPFAVNGGNACIDASANPYISHNILVLGLTHRLENKLQRNFFKMTVQRTMVGMLVLMPLQSLGTLLLYTDWFI
jgi:hypothetical protein